MAYMCHLVGSTGHVGYGSGWITDMNKTMVLVMSKAESFPDMGMAPGTGFDAARNLVVQNGWVEEVTDKAAEGKTTDGRHGCQSIGTSSHDGQSIKKGESVMLTRILVVAGVVMLFAGGVAIGEEKKAPAKTKPGIVKPSIKRERTVMAIATVEAIDLKNRVVTLKGPKGKIFDITAGDEVRNLAQVKVGDNVKVEYHESVAIEVRKPGKVPSGSKVTVAGERAKLGEKPAGMVSGQATMTATIEEIDAKNNHVTLKAPDGKSIFVVVKDPHALDNVKKGDEVVITVTKAFAISVEGTK